MLKGVEQRRRYEICLDSMRTLNALRGRMILALIGIAIGTASVIAMLHVGHVARLEAMRLYDELGTDRFMIYPSGENPGTIKMKWIEALPNQRIGVGAIAPIITNGSEISYDGRSAGHANFIATSHTIYEIGNAKLAQGRFTYDADGFEPYGVIGHALRNQILETTGRLIQPGDKIRAQNQIITVVGILKETPPNFFIDVDFNSTIVVPFKAARRIISSPSINGIAASLKKGFDEQTAVQATLAYFENLAGEGSVTTRTASEIIKARGEQMRIYGLLLLAVGSIALLVGGTGIMNVMLMNIAQRKQEIGLRRAIGAKQNDIVVMILSETVLLSLVGTIIGAILGVAAGYAFAEYSNWQFSFAPLTIPLGGGMAFCVGLFFGIYPALKAARLDPVLALRSQG